MRVLGDERNVERRAVVDEDLAVPVEDRPAGRAHPLQTDAIVLGERPVLVAFGHLEVPEPPQRQREEQEDADDRDDEPSAQRGGHLPPR